MFRSSIAKISILLVAFCLMSTGCSSALVGTWENPDPKADSGDFIINNATFKEDGTYVASARKGEESVRLAGTYEFDGFHLKLKTPGKQERTYNATHWALMGPSLELRDGEVKQTLKKK